MKDYQKRIDLHMHSTASDGSDTPEELLEKIKEAHIELFSLTDHDAIKGSMVIKNLLKEGDPDFLPGVEFSCKDELGKYHILGYNYDGRAESINRIVDLGHSYRMKKVRARIEFLKERFGFEFKLEDLKELLSLNNPGKPHIGNMMVRYGYAESKEQAINEFINKMHFATEYVRPEEAITGILNAGGIPVLAHPVYGAGDDLILGEEMDERLQHLLQYGLQGVEALYSGFTAKLRNEMLAFADKYDLYVTAGSDYHGTNKLIKLGDNGLDELEEVPERMMRFLHDAGLE